MKYLRDLKDKECYHTGYFEYIWQRDDRDRETDVLVSRICLNCGNIKTF